MVIYGFIILLKALRFLNIKFGYLSQCSVALFITLIFIPKIEKRTTMVDRWSVMDKFNEELTVMGKFNEELK